MLLIISIQGAWVEASTIHVAQHQVLRVSCSFKERTNIQFSMKFVLTLGKELVEGSLSFRSATSWGEVEADDSACGNLHLLVVSSTSSFSTGTTTH